MHPAKFYTAAAFGSLLGASCLCVSCKTLCEESALSIASGGGKQVEIVETGRRIGNFRSGPAMATPGVRMTSRSKSGKTAGQELVPKIGPSATPRPTPGFPKPLAKIDEREGGDARNVPKNEVLPLVEPVRVIPKPATRKVEATEVSTIHQDAESTIISVDEDNANRIIVAEGKDVEVNGSGGVIVISGGSGKLILSGSKNQVQCDSASEVKVTGDGNTLIMGMIGSGSIVGNGNVLSWGAGLGGADPIVEASGTGNEMKRLE